MSAETTTSNIVSLIHHGAAVLATIFERVLVSAHFPSGLSGKTLAGLAKYVGGGNTKILGMSPLSITHPALVPETLDLDDMHAGAPHCGCATSSHIHAFTSTCKRRHHCHHFHTPLVRRIPSVSSNISLPDQGDNRSMPHFTRILMHVLTVGGPNANQAI